MGTPRIFKEEPLFIVIELEDCLTRLKALISIEKNPTEIRNYLVSESIDLLKTKSDAVEGILDFAHDIRNDSHLVLNKDDVAEEVNEIGFQIAAAYAQHKVYDHDGFAKYSFSKFLNDTTIVLKREKW